MRAAVVGLVAGAGLLAACGGGDGGEGITDPPPGQPAVAEVVVTPTPVTLGVAHSFQLRAETRAADGAVLTGRAITWTSSDESVAAIDPASGATTTVTGRAPGSATITATSEGEQGTATVTVIAQGENPIAAIVVTPGVDTALVGRQLQLRAEARAADGSVLPGYTFSWSTRDPTLAAVDPATGIVTALAAGDAAIDASLAAPSAGSGSATIHMIAFRQLSAGGAYTCGVTTAGAAYCWGSNTLGRLGDGTMTGRTRPVPVAGGLSFEAVSAGSAHSCAVTTGGDAYCWGNNQSGQLGDETTIGSSTPVAVSGNHTFAGVDASGNHTCGPTPVGVGYCWGDNQFGQLGDGTTNNSPEPVAVATSSPAPLAVDFVQIGAGVLHTCGLSPRGAASCWGSNTRGQLGDGTTLDRLTPIAVAPSPGGSITFTALSLGERHTCGLSGSGVYCWGANSSGQLGDGTTVDRSTPGPVVLRERVLVTAVAAGASHTCGLDQTERAYCWGNNDLGQLGDGSTTSQTAPVAVSGDLTFISLTAGGAHTCGVTPDGRAYCWGLNSASQLGDGTDGTIESSLVPVAVVSP